MKPLYPAALALFAALASCSSSSSSEPEVDNPPTAASTSELAFSAQGAATSASSSSRAYEETPTTYYYPLDEDIEIKLRAYHRTSSGKTMEYDGQQDIPLTYQGPYRSRVARNYYYPLSGTMDFMAYCAVTPHTVTVANDFSFMEVDFADALQGDDDVLYAIPVNDAPCGNSAQTQDLNFNHSLAKLYFSIRAADSFGQNSITVTGVDITRCSLSGKMTISNDGGASGSYCSWEPYDSRLHNTLNESFPLTTTSHEHFIYVVPSEQTHVRLLYKISYENGDEKEATYINHKLDLTDLYWEEGHEYHYSYIIYENVIEVNYIDFQGHDVCTHCFIDSYLEF
ncbi:MAG: fimbrillin family protein [Bacteroidales bacterium]|nr:fimbrillin family protein [Bacteroidales bacterium]